VSLARRKARAGRGGGLLGEGGHRRASPSAQLASHGFPQAVLVAVQQMASVESRGRRLLLLGILSRHRAAKHVARRDGQASEDLNERHGTSSASEAASRD